MKFLLVVPKYGPRGYSYPFPFGLSYISAVLKRAGHTVHCLNTNHSDLSQAEAVAEAIRRFDPDVCGTGSISPLFKLVREIATVAKATKPSIINVVGGGLFSSAPELVSTRLPIDYGVVGEGELTIVELAEALEKGTDPASVAGLGIRAADGTLIRTASRTAIRDLATVPWPDHEAMGMEEFLVIQNVADMAFQNLHDQPRVLPIIASRSCPYGCTFCYHPTGRVYRERPLDDFFAELDHLVARHAVNLLDIYDDLFTAKRKRVLEFCERIKPYKLPWTVQLHVSLMDEEIIDRMKDAGCTLASYGLESANDDVLRSMQKKINRAKIETALAITHERRVGIQGNFIFGDTAETMRTVNDTLAWWHDHPQYRINLGFLQVFPGSPIYETARRQGKLPEASDDLPQGSINTTVMDDDTYNRLVRRIRVLREALVFPAKLVEFARIEETTRAGDPLFRIIWDCPRCDHRNVFDRVRADWSYHAKKFTFSCRECFSRFDLPNFAQPGLLDREADRLYAEISRLRETGQHQQSLELLADLANRPAVGGRVSDAVARARSELGRAKLELGHPPAQALESMEIAVLDRPFEPMFHLSLAMGLMAEGSLDAARLHCETAGRLFPPGHAGGHQTVANFMSTIAERQVGLANRSATYFLG